MYYTPMSYVRLGMVGIVYKYYAYTIYLPTPKCHTDDHHVPYTLYILNQDYNVVAH